ncbi:uncharacterized protein Rnb isoform X2 [Planococcus citri]|uniref:uncharacterized protein Rnb isoform X2 n=1 Tax=Planococcus citri TaxID=170843 RepID=UPI0031F8D684
MTDKESVAEITKILKSASPQKKLYHTLLHIHSDVIPSETKLNEFKEHDGIHCVIQFLSKPNERILNISLGILASCCANEDCCNKILSEGIESHLITILRSVNDDRIQYRCFKLISSLIKNSNFCSTIVSNNVLQLMAPVLDGDPSLFTKVIAIKTVQRIWIASNLNDRKMVAKSNIIQSVIKHLSSDDKDVQKTVLKVIYCVSKTRSDIILKQAFQEDTLKHIISKTSEFPMLILPIINYVSVMRCFYFELAKAGALEALFEQIRGINVDSSETDTDTILEMVLRSVQRLCIEPKCREKLCSIPDAFFILLNIIENCSQKKLKKYSILILTSFIYDDYSLKRLVRQRLIIVLASYLQIIVNDEGSPHDNNEYKNECPNLSSSPASSGRTSPLSDCDTVMAVSPSPNSDRYGFSPVYSESSDYSPVYSPVMEESDNDDEVEEECEKLSIDDASSKADSPFLPDDEDTVKPATEEKIFNLLKQLTYMGVPLYDLCAQRTWETFLNYLVLVRKSNAHVTAVLSSIAGNTSYFLYLLKSQFPLTVHKKLRQSVHVDCTVCGELDRCGAQILLRFLSVAESSYGNQIIKNELGQNCSHNNKMIYALMIPHIVKDPNHLEEYFLRYKLLECIIESFNNEDDEFALEEKPGERSHYKLLARRRQHSYRKQELVV